MIKTTMMSYCRPCQKPVSLYEEEVTKYEKQYFCVECKKYVRTLHLPKDK